MQISRKDDDDATVALVVVVLVVEIRGTDRSRRETLSPPLHSVGFCLRGDGVKFTMTFANIAMPVCKGKGIPPRGPQVHLNDARRRTLLIYVYCYNL